MSNIVPVNNEISARGEICGARTRSGGSCNQPAMPNGRCRLHGGKTPAGLASPHWKHGRYSKVAKLDRNLMEAYEESRSDPQILELTDDIAMLQGRIIQLLERLDTEESKERWQKTKETYRLMIEAHQRGDKIGMALAINDMGNLLRDGDKDYMVWDDVYKAMGLRAKFMGQEQKRRLEIHALVSADQAMGFLATVMHAVKTHVKDSTILQNIYDDVQEALDKNPNMATGLR